MGWERKRGKIEEFNRLLRGASDTGFSVQVGELGILPSVRYCITLYTDTRLPRDAAKTLVGIIAANLATKRAAASAVGLTGLFGYASTLLSGNLTHSSARPAASVGCR